MMRTEPLRELDPAVFGCIERERAREQDHLELIASENFTLPAVLEATGSVMTNKYAEGYPDKRYYGGCAYVDEVEKIAIARAKELFGAEHVNVQPHAGSPANIAVYISVLSPGDTLLTMSLSHGGHLTHGHPKNLSGILYNIVHYGVDEATGYIDYDALEKQAHAIKPRLITVGASAYPRVIDFARMGAIAKSCGALLMADIAHIAGLVAAGLHPSPFPHADFVTTTTHKTLRGPRGGIIMCKEPFAKGIDSAIFPGIQGGPLMHVIAAKAICLGEALRPEFRLYQQQVLDNAQALAKALMSEGCQLVGGGTENHLMLIDLRATHPDVSGREAQSALDLANITTNKNTIPGETRSPVLTSGIRVGTPAVTTRGMKEPHMIQIARAISIVLKNPSSPDSIAQAKDIALKLCAEFPLPYTN